MIACVMCLNPTEQAAMTTRWIDTVPPAEHQVCQDCAFWVDHWHAKHYLVEPGAFESTSEEPPRPAMPLAKGTNNRKYR